MTINVILGNVTMGVEIHEKLIIMTEKEGDQEVDHAKGITEIVNVTETGKETEIVIEIEKEIETGIENVIEIETERDHQDGGAGVGVGVQVISIRRVNEKSGTEVKSQIVKSRKKLKKSLKITRIDFISNCPISIILKATMII